MGELIQFADYQRLKRALKATPESEPFASKCMGYLYHHFGYADAVDTGSMQPVVHTHQEPAARPYSGISSLSEQALHDDICDAIRGYIVEALHPSARRHDILQRKQVDDITGLMNQLRHTQANAEEILPLRMREELQRALCSTSIFYYGTNIFAGTGPER